MDSSRKDSRPACHTITEIYNSAKQRPTGDADGPEETKLPEPTLPELQQAHPYQKQVP
jgi:hypothetical protein